jgi:hypothetical protein
MGSIKKLVKASIKDANIEGNPLKDGVATTAKFVGDSVESGEINDGTVTVDDLASPLNLSSKTVTLPNTSVTAGMLSDTLDLSSKTVTLPDGTISFDREYFNISLLGFKMAVTESLTVFNLVDGVVDEFHDESGTDEAEGSNDLYNTTDDYYSNSIDVSAGFSMTTITEPDTSTAGTNPTQGSGTMASFTVPANVTSLNAFIWGAGGGAGCSPVPFGPSFEGAGGGFTSGTITVSPGQTLYAVAGEGGASNSTTNSFLGGGEGEPGCYGNGGSGGGLAAVMTASGTAPGCFSAPQVVMIAGSGGGGGNKFVGGMAGGLQGGLGGNFNPDDSHFTTGPAPAIGNGGGGSQSAGGQGGPGSNSGSAGPTSYPGPSSNGQTGGFLFGGDSGVSPQGSGGGGSGYYGGGGAGNCTYNSTGGGGGGGSSYYGNPIVACGATLTGAPFVSPGFPFANPNIPNMSLAAGRTQPNYIACTSEGADAGSTAEDGYVLLTNQTTLSTTIVSNAFTSTSVATTSRIVVFEENIDTPTLNTDIIASISRDGGTTFTTATLTDSGYVTGASGQRILTGQATISGQPSGQSMRWKLALANNQVKIHGVSLSWA